MSLTNRYWWVRLLRGDKPSGMYEDGPRSRGIPHHRQKTSLVMMLIRRYGLALVSAAVLVLFGQLTSRNVTGHQGPLEVTSNHHRITIAPKDDRYRIDIAEMKAHSLDNASLPKMLDRSETKSMGRISPIITLEFVCPDSSQKLIPGWGYWNIFTEIRPKDASPSDSNPPLGSGTVTLLARTSVKPIQGRDDIKAVYYEIYHDKRPWDGLNGPPLNSDPTELPSKNNDSVSEKYWTRKIHGKFANQYQASCTIPTNLVVAAASPRKKDGTSGSRSRTWQPRPETASFLASLEESTSSPASPAITATPTNPFTNTYGGSLAISLDSTGGLALPQ